MAWKVFEELLINTTLEIITESRRSQNKPAFISNMSNIMQSVAKIQSQGDFLIVACHTNMKV
jgi:3-deoxy-D-manno-octulosonic acid (KDO) 8-phosphate synthase